MARHPAIHPSVAPRAGTPDLEPVDPDMPHLLDPALTASLDNCLSRNRARKCEGLKKAVFLERAHKFLSYWRTEDWEHDTTNYTDYDLLIRLVQYQDVHQALIAENERCPFAENTVDLIRGAQARAKEAGALRSANARVLDALDVIYDDICADTKKTKVPSRVQEMTDIVLRGLSVNAEKTPLTSNPSPCRCNKHKYPCGVIATVYWDAESAYWVCDCMTITCPE
ncbi:hypothetical protein PG991_008874 [Apiospora marii]|uniref:Uncharacterized protein n=1 Tax=Apiospora marii TaxID=335849 RepID=A0ABR1RLZ3_9PEZI